MARKVAAGPHLRRIRAHHKRKKAHLLKLFHKVRSHPGCYKHGHKPYKGKAPKSLPRKPKGLNKRGSGFWDSIKSAWHWVTGHAKKHGAKVMKEVKKEVTKQATKHGKALMDEAGKRGRAYLKKTGDAVGKWGSAQMAAVGAKARNHVEGYIKAADKKVNALAKRIDSGVSKYTGEGGMPGKTLGK